ncbi:phosphotransferase [Paenibacillus sp. RC67]|uniref:phosphotransferase n=1 Tax=Paenibacillus sp. RC67 TaxID=3039392 RepID=UPI0024AD36EB|nr:phosphotransferase [Paenibacillus sp. RC67]
MDIRELLRRDYAIDALVEVYPMGRNDCYLVITESQQFVCKKVGRFDFVQIYNKVQRVLDADCLRQAKLIPTVNGDLLSSNAWCLLEYIPGDAPEHYDDEQFTSTVIYIHEYNRCLTKVPFQPEEIQTLNSWDRVKSVQWMSRHLESIIEQCQFDSAAQALIRNAGKLLSEYLDFFHLTPKQLIHADLGPGNVIFYENQIVSIIDFTPEYENELYSLSQFLYWTCLYHVRQSSSVKRINEALALYAASSEQAKPYDPDDLFAYLLKSALFRALGLAQAMLDAKSFEMKKMKGRLVALETLLDIKKNIT